MREEKIMLQRFHGATVLGAFGLAATVFACTAGTVGSSSGSTLPQTQAEVTSTAGLVITATISAATLGEECGNAGGSLKAPSAGDCAPSADGGTCGGPSSYCQQSNVQIAFTASAGSKGATVEVVSVTLHDAATGNLVDTLTASKPQSWSGSTYVAWDETIKPGTQLKASYDLTAPKWSNITAARTTSAYSTKYKLNVTLRIDGVDVVLQSTDLNREPQVAT